LIGQIKAFTAQGRLSGFVLGLLPITFALIITAINPTYLEPLLTTPVGKNLVLAAVIMQITGFLVIRKILKIKLL
jgi:tight adherence protein B